VRIIKVGFDLKWEAILMIASSKIILLTVAAVAKRAWGKRKKGDKRIA
jgi:hypothetical protein